MPHTSRRPRASSGRRSPARGPGTPRTPRPPQAAPHAELDRARPGQIEMHKGNPDAELSILVSVEGDDAKRLEKIANERGQRPGEVVSELLRNTS